MSCQNPEKMRKVGFDAILKDDAIQEFIPRIRYLPEEEKCKLNDYYQVLTYERQEKLINLELQRWFDDFIPSDLDRIYRKENGKTLRYVLRDDCKNIKNKVYKIPSNIIEKVYNDGDAFSGSQISRINKLFARYCDEITEYKTVREKIELLIHAHMAEGTVLAEYFFLDEDSRSVKFKEKNDFDFSEQFYSVNVDSFYTGAKYNDTCLAELNFFCGGEWLFGEIE